MVHNIMADGLLIHNKIVILWLLSELCSYYIDITTFHLTCH